MDDACDAEFMLHRLDGEGRDINACHEMPVVGELFGEETDTASEFEDGLWVVFVPDDFADGGEGFRVGAPCGYAAFGEVDFVPCFG